MMCLAAAWIRSSSYTLVSRFRLRPSCRRRGGGKEVRVGEGWVVG